MADYQDPYAPYKDQKSPYYTGNKYGEGFLEGIFGAKARERRQAQEKMQEWERMKALGVKKLPPKPLTADEIMAQPKSQPLSEPEAIKARPVAAVPQSKVQSSPQQTMATSSASRDGLPENADGYNATGLAGNDLTNEGLVKDGPNWFDKFSDVLGKVKQASYPKIQPTPLITASAGNGGQGGSLSGALNEQARAKQAMPTYYDKLMALYK